MKHKDAASDVSGEKEERLMKQEKEIRLLERQRVRCLCVPAWLLTVTIMN